MSDMETSSTPIADEKPPLSNWQRWLEFLQVIAVLIIVAGVTLPFALGPDVGVWFSAAGLAFVGVGVAYIALGLIDVDSEISTKQEYEITPTRLLTLESTGVPPDILDALRNMCAPETQRWRGSAVNFRDDFYGRVGEKRGAAFLRILPYLAVYAAPQQPEPSNERHLAAGIVPGADRRVPVTDVRLSLSGPTSL